MNKVLRGGARDIIYKVFLRCIKESQAGKFLSRDVYDVYKRTAEFTGVSQSTVRRIAKVGNQCGGKFSTNKHRKGRPPKKIDDFDICAIRQKIQIFYTLRKEVPSIKKLLVQLQKDIGFNGSREHLRRLLQKIGFTFKKCQSNKHALIENPIIAHKREEYLKIIMDNRNLPEELQKEIIYVDESFIDPSYKIKKWWQSIKTEGQTSDIPKGKRWIVLHAGTEKGFVPNALHVFSGNNKHEDYHSEMNKSIFTKWVMQKLIPNIKDPSIIVMDNAPYHCIILNKAPTSAYKVEEIKLWLEENNIPFDPDLRKPSLLALVRKYKPDPIYEIDEILGLYGHVVVRLPPYHCDLNPMEMIWPLAKRKVAEQNVGAKDIKELAIEAFNSITADEWKNCCEHIKKIEKEYYDSGQILYNAIDELVTQVGENSSSDDEYSDSDESSVDIQSSSTK